MRVNSVGKLFIENPDTLWYSQSEVDEIKTENYGLYKFKQSDLDLLRKELNVTTTPKGDKYTKGFDDGIAYTKKIIDKFSQSKEVKND